MSNHTATSHDELLVMVNMQAAVVLDVRFVTNENFAYIASNSRIRPNPHMLSQGNLAYHNSGWIYER
jgi:hypothetical protein